MGQVKNFFVNYRRRFNLDEVLQEWEAEQGTRAPNGDSAASGEEGKNSSTAPSGKSTDEEDEEVRRRHSCSVTITRTTRRYLWLRPLLSAGSGDLIGGVARRLLCFFGSGSGDIQCLLVLLPPSAPSPLATLPPGHALPTPPASTPPAAGPLPAAPAHPAAAPASHSPIQPPAPPPQPPPRRPHDPLWQPRGLGSKLGPAALRPGCPVRDGLVLLRPLGGHEGNGSHRSPT